MQTLQNDLRSIIAAQASELTQLRRDLHAHPQLAFQETYASGKVQEALTDAGIPFEAGVAETGVVAWLMPDQPEAASRPGVALRADMDALPIQEQTGAPYASKYPGCMHACGHDGHTTILVGAARTLAERRDRLTRPVKFVFQPAEESLGGGRHVVEAGALEARIGGFGVQRAFALHGAPRAPLGMLRTRTGPIMAASSRFSIDVTGPGGHAAGPHRTADTIVAAAQIITALQTVVARNVPPEEAAVVTIGQIHGGSASNVIPQLVSLSGTIRHLNPQVGELLVRRIDTLARRLAEGMGCEVDAKFFPGYPVLVNDPLATEEVLATARRCLGDNLVEVMPHSTMGGEDFAYYAQRVPSCFFYLGLAEGDVDAYPGLHTPLFDFNDAAIPVGVMLMCELALQ